ncbi:MAG: hypothetical protein OEM97_07720 [Acidimicrobiia bacterium]|nr:hypothetical protein [Acidimicrobiia bacterium]
MKADQRRWWQRFAALTLAVGIAMAGCGGGDENRPSANPGPVVASACEAGTPDCDDTATTGDDAPSPSIADEPVTPDDQVATGVLANG